MNGGQSYHRDGSMKFWALVAAGGIAVSCASQKSASNSGAGGSPGINATCGNGKLDPGEDCESGKLNGGSCTSLGFDSGALSCAPSCRYDTSGCVGSITLTVNATRTSCAAPCAVFFDATSTVGLMAGDYVGASFSWDFDSTSVDPTGAHEQAIGFGVGHVFDKPGTYQVGVRARDLAGHAGSATIPITVTAMTGATYYVASSGDDKNAGTTMAQPLKTFATALGKAGSQVSVLFRRGDTFAAPASASQFSVTGPALIGAYTDPSSSSTAAPIIMAAASGGTTSMMPVMASQDLRLVDLHFVSAGASNGIVITGSPNTLLERVEVEGLGQGNSTVQLGEVLYTEMASDGTFFVDCHIHNFMGSGFYGANVRHLAIIGTTIDGFGGGEHGIRVQGGNFSFIASNTIVSNDTSSALSGITIRGDDTNIVVANNRSNRLIEFTPQNTQSVEHVIHGLADGNVINDNRTTDFYFYAMGVTAQHIVIRNSIFMNAPVGVGVDSMPQLPANFVDQIYIYNNTDYFFPASYSPDNGANLAEQLGTTGNLVVENNIFAHGLTLTNQQMAFISKDGKGTVTEDHNLGFGPNGKGTWTPGTGAGDIVGNPMFVSTDITSANAFQLGAGSAALDVGASLPVFQDFAGNPRPSGAGYDIGAFEFQTP